MNIEIKKTGHLIYGKLKIKCSFGNSGINSKKKEGDNSTPKGKFTLGNLYYRKDRIKNLKSFLNKKIIKKTMAWCHDPKNIYYNREIIYLSAKSGEKLYRHDHLYDLLIVINYNTKPNIPNRGSAIFLHLTNNLKPTKGCVAIKKKDFLILCKLINKQTKMVIG